MVPPVERMDEDPEVPAAGSSPGASGSLQVPPWNVHVELQHLENVLSSHWLVLKQQVFEGGATV